MIDIRKAGKPLAVSILLLLLATIWSFLILPYIELVSDEIMIVSRGHKKLSALSYLEKNKTAIHNKYRAMKNNRSLDRVYLNQANGVIAEAKLQGIIRRLIEKNGSVLSQSSLIKPSDDNNNTITMKVSMRGSVESTYKIFHEIENGWPVMVVKNIGVVSSPVGYAIKQQQSNLDSSYEVTAYVK